MKTKNRNLTLAVFTSLFIAAGSAHAAITINNHSFEVNRNYDQTAGGGGFASGESRDFGANGETDTVQTGDANNITGWTTVTTDNTSVVAGAQISVGFKDIVPSHPTGTGSAPFPQALSLMAGASTGQVTSTGWASLAAGDVLTMTVAVGDRNNTGTTWAAQSFFGITDGLATGRLTSNTVANSGLIGTPPGGVDSGTMGDLFFNYTVQASDLSRIGNVGVLLVAFGDGSSGNGLGSNVNQAFFDNVRLSVAPIPEPSSALLLGTLGALALLRRRR